MRILFIIETSNGGSGKHVIELSKSLKSLGHEVHLIYSPRRMDKQFASAVGELSGVITFPISMRRSPHPSDIISIITIFRYIAAHGEFDIIHGHSSKGGALARLVAFWTTSARLYTPHAFITLDPALGKLRRFVYGSIERLFANFLTDIVVVVSEDERGHALELGVRAEKIRLIPPGINLEAPSNRELLRLHFGLTPKDLCIGWVGRFVPQKAVERIIQAMAQIIKEFANLKLILLGDGPLEFKVRALAIELGINERILWLKNMNGTDVMPCFDIFVLPSRYEGMPRVVLEALALGVPVIAMQVGGVATAVRSGVNGYVVPPGDMIAFIDKIRRLVLDQDLRHHMQTSAYTTAKRFSIRAMTDQTLEVYRLAIKNRHHRLGNKSRG